MYRFRVIGVTWRLLCWSRVLLCVSPFESPKKCNNGNGRYSLINPADSHLYNDWQVVDRQYWYIWGERDDGIAMGSFKLVDSFVWWLKGDDRVASIVYFSLRFCCLTWISPWVRFIQLYYKLTSCRSGRLNQVMDKYVVVALNFCRANSGPGR